ncbi:MAG: hypothetical protein KDB14_23165 [Planctomycetales bacterium]|nr:hypothetical protein [Planctomycetales bacterium]
MSQHSKFSSFRVSLPEEIAMRQVVPVSRGFRIASTLGWLGLIAASLTGCTRSEFDLQLEPKGGELSRELTIAGGDPGSAPRLTADEAQRLETIYGKRPGGGGPFQVAKSFRRDLPDDVGGKGAYVYWESSLGGLAIYGEQFRGEADYADLLEARLKTADAVADLVRDWALEQAADKPSQARVRQWFDVDLRKDLRGLTALMAMSHFELHAGRSKTVFSRALMYLWDRGYVDPDRLPSWQRAFESENPASVLEAVCEILDWRLRAEPGVRNALPVLADSDALRGSFSTYLDGAVERLSLLPTMRPPNPEKPTKPEELFGAAVGFALLGQPLLHYHDNIRSQLRLKQAPLATNGEWDPADKKVTWNWQLSVPGEYLPELRLPSGQFAAWVEPNEAYQTKRFGKVLLDGEPLAKYVMWRRGLTDAEGRLWDAFMDGLAPTDDLAARIGAFEFPGDSDRKLIERPRQLMTQ